MQTLRDKINVKIYQIVNKIKDKKLSGQVEDSVNCLNWSIDRLLTSYGKCTSICVHIKVDIIELPVLIYVAYQVRFTLATDITVFIWYTFLCLLI